jgi:hypothetical protein
MVGKKSSDQIYIPGQDCLRDRSVGGFDDRFAWIKVLCGQQLGYWVPGPAQCEAIVSSIFFQNLLR